MTAIAQSSKRFSMEDASFSALDTDRLTIRRFWLADAVELAIYRSHPEVARYQDWTGFSVDDATSFIDSLEGRAPGTPSSWFQFALVLKDTDQLVGDCGLRCPVGDPRRGEVGFTVARAYQRQGIATEAMNALLAYVLETLQLRGLVATTDERNQAAQRVLEKLGFHRQHDADRHVEFKGEWVTELTYSLREHDWLTARGLVEVEADRAP